MILTRSPFYYNVVFANNYVTSIDFTVEIGTGSTTTITVSNTYELTKLKPSTTSTNTWLDISPFIRDLYTFAPIDFTGISVAEIQTSLINAVLLARVTAATNDTIGSSEPDLSQKYICTDGFGYYTEGQNEQPTKKILLSHNEYKADSRGYFVVPLRCATGDGNPTINTTPVALSFTDNNQNYIKYLVIPCAAYTGIITVAFEGETITIELVDECEFDLKEVQFINRYGALEVVHFYKASKENLIVSEKKFKNAHTNGTSYDTKVHQLKRLNVKGNKELNIETGFLNEEYNDTIEELMLSEHAWIGQVPINVESKSLAFKTRIVDKLISYSIDFEYAFDEINNV